MRKYLNPQITCIFVILGKGCNMKCKYCLQTPYNRQEVTKKDLPLVVDFIDDTASNQERPLTVQFFGGEPLLYIDDMKRIVKRLKHNRNAQFSIITNGTKIDAALAEYFNEHNFNVAVSWDGGRSNEIRGLDVFKQNKENLFKIKSLGISSIISAYCYPQDLLDSFAVLHKEYQETTGRGLGLAIEEFLDTGIENCQELLANQTELTRQMEVLCQHYWWRIEQAEHNPHYANFVDQLLQGLRHVLNRDFLLGAFTRCGDGTTVINVDLQGNLYKCHNHEVKIGTVNSPFWDVLQRSILTDNSVKHRKECEQCYVAPFCLGGCALIEEPAWKSMCDLHIALYKPVMDLVLQIKERFGTTSQD